MNLAQRLVLSASTAVVMAAGGQAAAAQSNTYKALNFVVDHIDAETMGTIGAKQDLTKNPNNNGFAPDLAFVGLGTGGGAEGGLAWTSKDNTNGVYSKSRIEAGAFDMGDVSFGDTNVAQQLGFSTTDMKPPTSDTGRFYGGRFENKTTSSKEDQRHIKKNDELTGFNLDDITTIQTVSGFAGVGDQGGVVAGVKKETQQNIKTQVFDLAASDYTAKLSTQFNKGMGFMINTDDDVYRADYRIKSTTDRVENLTTPGAEKYSQTNLAAQVSLVSEKGKTDGVLYGHASHYMSINPEDKAFMPDQVGVSVDASYGLKSDFNAEASVYAGWNLGDSLKMSGPMGNVFENLNIGPKVSIDDKGKAKVQLAVRSSF